MRHFLAMLITLGLFVPEAVSSQSLNTAMWGSVSKGHRNATKSVKERILTPTPPIARGERVPDFTYRYDRNRTTRNLQRFVDSVADPAAKADLQRVIGANPALMDDIRRSIKPYGFDGNNVADAYALWWINAWLVANKRDEDPDTTTIAMVKQQARGGLATSAGMKSLNDAARQEYAEVLMLQALMLSDAFDQVKSDPAKLDQFATIVRDGTRNSGLDLMAIELTSKGFVPR